MKVFVAGATGVLGRPTVAALVAAGHAVRAVARDERKAQWLREQGADPVAVDLFDQAALTRALVGSEALLRLTTRIPSLLRMRSQGAWAETIRLRTEGARLLVDAAREVGAALYIHESVTFVYRDAGTAWIHEDDPVDVDTSPILRAAMEGEHHTERFTTYGGRGVVLRFGAFYAPDAPSTRETLQLARRRMLAIPGDGANYLSSIFVPDAATAVVAALWVPAGVYNVVDDEPLAFRDYVAAMTEAAGLPPPWRVPPWLGRRLLGSTIADYLLRSQRVAHERLTAAAGWHPSVANAREGWRRIARG